MSETASELVSHKREERWFLVRLVLLFVLGVGAFLLLIAFRSKVSNTQFPRVKLPDGTWLVVRSVTVGTNHPIEIPYTRNMQLSRWERSYKNVFTTQAPRMAIWLTHENDRGEMLDLDWFKRCELVLGDDSRVSPAEYQRQRNDRNGGSGSGVGSEGYSDAKPFGPSVKLDMSTVRFHLPLLRPNAKGMHLEIYDGTKERVVQLPIPYPVLPNAPDDWQPEPLPATRTDGNLTITLKSIKFNRYQDHTGVSLSPQLEYIHDGQPSNTWSASQELEDALGNISRPWNCDLSTQESGWKLRLKLHQGTNGRFLPEETRKLASKPLPAAKQVTFVTESYTVNGTPVSLIGLGGTGPCNFTVPNSTTKVSTGKYQPGQGGSGMSSSCSGSQCQVELSCGHPFLITSSLGGGDGTVQLVFRDQSGEVLQLRGSSGTQGMTFYFFEPLPTTTAVDIEIISQQFRHAEFMIAPPKPEEIKSPK